MSVPLPSSRPRVIKCVCPFDPRPPRGVLIHSLSGMSMLHGTLSAPVVTEPLRPCPWRPQAPMSLGWFSQGPVDGAAGAVGQPAPHHGPPAPFWPPRVGADFSEDGDRRLADTLPPSSDAGTEIVSHTVLETSVLLSLVLRPPPPRQSRHPASSAGGQRNPNLSFGADTMGRGRGHVGAACFSR